MVGEEVEGVDGDLQESVGSSNTHTNRPLGKVLASHDCSIMSETSNSVLHSFLALPSYGDQVGAFATGSLQLACPCSGSRQRT